MDLSISQLSDLTGCDRRTIAKNLEGVHYKPGERGAFLYESRETLPVVYAVDNLEAAGAKQALSRPGDPGERGPCHSPPGGMAGE